MRAVIQRVKKAKVLVKGREISSIGKGLLVFVAVGKEDSESAIDYMERKISELRIFEDEKGNFNLSLGDVGGEILLVSQFTLYGDCRRGRRPDFHEAAPSEKAKLTLEKLAQRLKERGFQVKTGVFGAHMGVELENDGPVTILLDSERRF
jgi:D-tyrosyl-tRNA(Tyr) deacylase